MNLVVGFWSVKVDELDLIQMKREMPAKLYVNRLRDSTAQRGLRQLRVSCSGLIWASSDRGAGKFEWREFWDIQTGDFSWLE